MVLDKAYGKLKIMEGQKMFSNTKTTWGPLLAA